VKLKLEIVDMTRKTISVGVVFSDRNDAHISGNFVRDSVNGKYETAGVYVLERGKLFSLEYKLCHQAKYTWCQGVLNLTAQ
jgi:hypothetical protein